MRTKNLVLILCCIVLTSLIFIILGPAGQQNDSLKNIVTQTHQQFNKLQENLRATEAKKFDIDPKFLAILGFSNLPPSPLQTHNSHTHQQLQQQTHHSTSSSSSSLTSQQLTTNATPYNGTKANFTIVTYVQEGQAPSAILLSQNIAAKFPNEYLVIYDLGLSEDDSRALSAFCNSTKCSVINYDLSVFPSYVTDQRMHAYRPIVIKDALMRSKKILFTENSVRIRGNSRDLYNLRAKAGPGVLGWTTSKAVSTRTHPKMFDYFQTDAEDFIFLRMVELDKVFFADTPLVEEKILLPWIKCALTLECIDPIGAQSNGCKYNKKPQYRYSGCHAYDTSAFNIVLGLTWHLDDSKYSLPGEDHNIFYQETLEQATKILENRRRNSSETSDHPFSDD